MRRIHDATLIANPLDDLLQPQVGGDPLREIQTYDLGPSPAADLLAHDHPFGIDGLRDPRPLHLPVVSDRDPVEPELRRPLDKLGGRRSRIRREGRVSMEVCPEQTGLGRRTAHR
jgi:hypothetical protein